MGLTGDPKPKWLTSPLARRSVGVLEDFSVLDSFSWPPTGLTNAFLHEVKHSYNCCFGASRKQFSTYAQTRAVASAE